MNYISSATDPISSITECVIVYMLRTLTKKLFSVACLKCFNITKGTGSTCQNKSHGLLIYSTDIYLVFEWRV